MGIDDAEWAPSCLLFDACMVSTHLFLFLPLHRTDKVFADNVPRCVECDGIVKPGECSSPHSCSTAGSRTICHLYVYHVTVMVLSYPCHVYVTCMTCPCNGLSLLVLLYLLLVHTFDYVFAIRHCLLWRESSGSVRQTPRAGTVGLNSLTAQHINIMRMCVSTLGYSLATISFPWHTTPSSSA